MTDGDHKAVFLSYASQDAEVARKICDALRAAGVEVWFDQSELRGGDAWDQKIRRQIKDCALFVPIISANTQARTEGYFRLEWRIADQRTHLMAKGRPFLLPVVIDETRDTEAHVPDSFLDVQWTRLADGAAPPNFCARVQSLLGGSGFETGRARPAEPDERVASPTRPAPRRTWRSAAIFGGAVVVAVLLTHAWRQKDKSGTAATAAAPASAAAMASAAEIARVRAALVPDRWLKEDFDAVSPTLDRIIQANPDAADAWALRSIINSLQVIRNFDSGTKPLELGKAAAERALRLAPGLPLGEIARALHLTAMTSRGGDPRASLPHLERGVAALPPDAITRYAELCAYFFAYDFEGGLRSVQAWLKADPRANFPMWMLGQQYFIQRQPADAEKWAEAAAADPNITGVRAFYSLFESKYYLRADLAAARAALERVPAGSRAVHRLVHGRWLLAMADQRWDEALQEIAGVPESLLFDRTFHGPKALLAALAHQRAGQADTATIKFRDAERLLREQLVADPDNEEWHTVLAVTLACAGRAAEARSELALVEPLVKKRAPGPNRSSLVMLLAQAHAALGQVEPLGFWLRELFSAASQTPFTPNSLRLDPRFAGALESPPIRALLAEFAKLDAPSISASGASDQKSVAVLAFENLSGDKENEYFSDGISEELLNVLAKVPGLRVAARTSAFYFKGKQVPVAEIAKPLGVAFLVEGSVRKSGSRLRITAQLINAADGFRVWSDTFDRELKDVFALQDEIAGLIAGRLQLELGSSGPRAKPVNPRAHELVLQGRHFWNQRSQTGFAKAEASFMEAIALEPEYAAAYGGLAEVHAIRGAYLSIEGEGDPEPSLVAAERAARAALQLDPRLSEAHAVLGNVFWLRGRNDEADAEYRLTFAFNPSNATAHLWYAAVVAARGRLDLAIDELRSAVALDPLSFSAMGRLANILYWAQDYSEAMRLIDRAMALESRPFIPNRSARARILLALGRRDEAIEMARLVRQSQADEEFRLSVDPPAIWVLRQAGRADEAEAYAAEVFRRSPGNYELRSNVLVALGRFEEALPYLENRLGEISKHHPDRFTAFFWGEMWDPFRNDPRFQQLMVKLGCAKEYKVARETLARMLKEQAAKK